MADPSSFGWTWIQCYAVQWDQRWVVFKGIASKIIDVRTSTVASPQHMFDLHARLIRRLWLPSMSQWFSVWSHHQPTRTVNWTLRRRGLLSSTLMSSLRSSPCSSAHHFVLAFSLCHWNVLLLRLNPQFWRNKHSIHLTLTTTVQYPIWRSFLSCLHVFCLISWSSSTCCHSCSLPTYTDSLLRLLSLAETAIFSSLSRMTASVGRLQLWHICSGNFPKRKKWPQSLCQMLRVVIIVIVINSTHCVQWLCVLPVCIVPLGAMLGFLVPHAFTDDLHS